MVYVSIVLPELASSEIRVHAQEMSVFKSKICKLRMTYIAVWFCLMHCFVSLHSIVRKTMTDPK